MKRLSLILIMGLLVACGVEKPEIGKTLPAWQEGELDVHFINTGRGECTWQVMPDGTTVLVDASGSLLQFGVEKSDPLVSKPNNDISAGQVIVDYINHFNPEVSRGHINYFVLSHLDGDHIGSYNPELPMHESGKFRIASVQEIGTKLIFDNVLDRNYPDYDYPYDLRSVVTNPVTAERMVNYTNFLEWTAETNGTKLDSFRAGSNSQIVPIHNADCGVSVRNYSGNGAFWTGEGEESVRLVYSKEEFAALDSSEMPKENVFTCSYILSFGEFDIFLGGDLQYNGKHEHPCYDVEAPVARVAHKGEVMKANHHGTASCNGEELLEVLHPDVWIVCPWRDVHPRPASIDRVLGANPDCELFSTNMAEINFANIGDRINEFAAYEGHVVVRVAPDGQSYMIYVLDDNDQEYKVKSIHGPYKCSPKSDNMLADGRSGSDFFHSDSLNAYAIYRTYPEPVKALTPAPKGYEPFYLGSYARHGSRKLHLDEYTDIPMAVLAEADAKGNLTPLGKEVYAKVEAVDSDMSGSLGVLTAAGVQQHKGIAERMYENYPEIFAAPDVTVDCYSTEVQRTMMSMFACNEVLLKRNPDVVINRSATETNAFLRGKYDKPYSVGNVHRLFEDFIDEYIDLKPSMSKIFKVVPDIDQAQLTRCLYLSGAIMHGLDIEEETYLWDLYTYDELYQLQQGMSYMMYVKTAGSPQLAYSTLPSMIPLLRHFMDEADKAVADGRPCADLRFGHDSYLVPFVSLLGLNGYDRQESDPRKVGDIWQDYAVAPMAGNVQFVLYGNGTDDVLVKVLHNEVESTIPVETDIFPYYHWSDVREYYNGLIGSYSK